MGKITNSLEIIPIDGPSGLHSRHLAKEASRYCMSKMSYMGDPFIVSRVKQYLESNTHKTYVDITDMADTLQTKFPEYSKRKRNAFRGLVKRAYSVVLQSHGNNLNPSSSDGSDVEDVCEDEIDEGNLGHIDPITQMYAQSLLKNSHPAKNDHEPIDISSDDSSEQPMEAPLGNNGSGAGLLPTPDGVYPLPPFVKKQFPPVPMPERGKKRKVDHPGPAVLKRKKDVPMQRSNVSFKNVGGMDKVLEGVCKLLVHVRHPEVYKQIGLSPPRGFLLHGPPGCGKTLLANAIAGELNVPLLKVAAPELVAGVSGESEERIRELFDKAADCAPCVLFIDEVDAITPNRQNAQKEMERRIVAQLLSCLDDLNEKENGDGVLVIGATNRPDSLDPALRRAGRFDREVCLGIPNCESRVQILKVQTADLKLTADFDYLHVAKRTPGFVGADLLALAREAAMAAIDRVFAELNSSRGNVSAPQQPKSNGTPEASDDADKTPASEPQVQNTTDLPVLVEDNVGELPAVVGDPTQAQQEPESELVPADRNDKTATVMTTSLEDLKSWLHDQAPLSPQQLQDLCITMEDFERALQCVQPSSKREGFATVPDVTWDDVGSLRDVRDELQMCILGPVRHSEQFRALGLSCPAGVLLCGPPGCGKTLLAKAIANEAGINFISVKGPELLNMYVGESERAVRVCFQRARNSAPCVIFFDELDALCPKRSDSGESGASMRVVNQMLTEMDGVESREGVFLMAASNRPDIVDPAVLRPGRLDKILYVGLPSATDRVDILQAVTKRGTRPRLAPDVDLEAIGRSERCDGYTGADLAALVREAAIEAVRQCMLATTTPSPLVLTNDHFNRAIAKIRPSVSEKDQKHYEKLRKLYSAQKEEVPPTDEEIMECS